MAAGYPNLIARFVFALPVLLAAAVVPAAPAAAQEAVPAENVAPDATSGNGQTKVVRDQSGTLYAIYTAPHQGADAVFVAGSTDEGRSWYKEAVLSRTGIRAGLGTLAVDPTGVLHAGWVDYETVGHVWHAARTDTWSEPEKISPGLDYAGFPAMAADRGGTHVLWYGAKPNTEYSHGSQYEIEHTYLTGTGWSEPELVSIGSFDALNPTAAASPDDSVVAGWYQRTGELYRANVAFWTDPGWEVPTSVSPPTANALAVSMAIGEDGAVHLVWQQFAGETPAIAYAAFRDDGWTDPEFISPGPAAAPVVAAQPDGRVVAAWSTAEGIEARRWDGSWGDPVAVGEGDFPALLPGDQVSILWTRPQGTGYELAFAPLDFTEFPSALLVAIILAAAALAAGIVLVRRRALRSRGVLQGSDRPPGARR